MTKEKSIHIRSVFGILLSISIVIAGVCLIAGCLTIYYSGEQPYSRQSVADTFQSIALPVYICLILTGISFIWEWFSPFSHKGNMPSKNHEMIHKRMLMQKDISAGDSSLLTKVEQERKHRKMHTLIRTALICITGIVFLTYALDGEHFHQSNINESMIQAMWVLIPCLILSFGYTIFTVYDNEKSLTREIALLKQLPSKSAAKKDSEVSAKSSEKRQRILRFTLLAIGIIFFIYGFISGGTIDVLTKAINICTECIGLG